MTSPVSSEGGQDARARRRAGHRTRPAVTQDTGAVSPPYVLDVGVLTAIARGDAEVTGFVLGHDARHGVNILPALAVAAASLDARPFDADKALRGLGQLANAVFAPVQGTGQALMLAAVAARTGLDAWHAHVAAVATASGCATVTLDAATWREHAGELDPPIRIIEIADPDLSAGRVSARSDMYTRHDPGAGSRARCSGRPPRPHGPSRTARLAVAGELHRPARSLIRCGYLRGGSNAWPSALAA